MYLKIDKESVHVRVAQNGRLAVYIDQTPTDEHGYFKLEYLPNGLKLAQALQLLGTQPREGPVVDKEKDALLKILFGPPIFKPEPGSK